MDILSFLCILINLEMLFCQMFFLNGSNSTREAATKEKPKLEPFLEEPEPYQTDPYNKKFLFWEGVVVL